MNTLDKIRPYAKAIIAFLTPGVVALGAAVTAASPGGSTITGPEWIGIAVACVLTASGVYATPNRPRPLAAPLHDADAPLRPTFHGGRLPNDPTKPRMRLRLTGPAAPPSVDWLSKVASWPMYANDRIGDCTCAAAGHMEQAWTSYASLEVTVPESAVLALYEAASGYDPATGTGDNGAVMQDVCGLWRKTGLGGHKILAFAQVDHRDAVQVRAAIAAFGALYVGINFPDTAMQQFDAGQPWDVVKGAQIEGGHAIHVGAYDTAAGTYDCVTWGAVQPLTQAFWDTYVEEAWVVITQEWVEANGFTPAGADVAALGATFTQLTGEPSPFPAPAPGPTPAPTPAPVPDVAEELSAALTRYVAHNKDPLYLTKAAKAWLAEQ